MCRRLNLSREIRNSHPAGCQSGATATEVWRWITKFWSEDRWMQSQFGDLRHSDAVPLLDHHGNRLGCQSPLNLCSDSSLQLSRQESHTERASPPLAVEYICSPRIIFAPPALWYVQFSQHSEMQYVLAVGLQIPRLGDYPSLC